MEVPTRIPYEEMEIGKKYLACGAMRKLSGEGNKIEVDVARSAGRRTRALSILNDPNAEKSLVAKAAYELLPTSTREAIEREKDLKLLLRVNLLKQTFDKKACLTAAQFPNGSILASTRTGCSFD